ncbi:unnamed protein product [Coccothraustes coccothraustes]
MIPAPLHPMRQQLPSTARVAIPGEDEPPRTDGSETSDWSVFSASREPVGISASSVTGKPFDVLGNATHGLNPWLRLGRRCCTPSIQLLASGSLQSLRAIFAAVARAPGEPGGASAGRIPGEGSKSPPVLGGGFSGAGIGQLRAMEPILELLPK